MEQSLQQAVLEQSDIHMQKVKLGTYLILFTNINLKHIIDQHITKKLQNSQQITQQKIQLILGMTITFWIKTPQAKSMKELIDELSYILDYAPDWVYNDFVRRNKIKQN